MQELAGKVIPDHLSMLDPRDGSSPMQWAFEDNPEWFPIVWMLILRGVDVRPQDFPASNQSGTRDLRDRRRLLLASLEADLRLNDQILICLFLGCGVHGPQTTTTFTTTTTTATTKRVRTQQPDGGWSAPVSVPCEPHLVVTAAASPPAPAMAPAPASWWARIMHSITRPRPPDPTAENHLPKLRGFRNSEVRMLIASYLGVRPAVELARLRAARDVVAALPQQRWYQRWYQRDY